nr:hypothetical protein [Pedobacter sp. ASV19]
MTIKELKAKIADLPDNMDVMVEQTNEEGRYGMSQTVEVRSVQFSDPEVPKKDWATEKCLIISDEF